MIGMRGKENQIALDLMCKYLNLLDKTMAEIGAYAGEGTEVFARYCNTVYAIDSWDVGKEISNGSIHEHKNLMTEDVEKAFNERVKEYPGVVKLKMYDMEALGYIDEQSLDFVYIDAEHTEEEVRRQITMWLPKLRMGGIMGGHDFNSSFPGVVKAVREALGEPDKLFTDGGTSWAKFI